MYAADPSLAGYLTVPSVPVLDEHVMEDAKKGLRVAVDAQALREIADNTNRRAAERNQRCPLIVGHTSDDPQAPERPVVGYADNFRVKPFHLDPSRTALYADFHYRPDRAGTAKDFPRRSVELWWERKEIDPIALLGGTTPERDLGDLDLGTLKFSRGEGKTVYRFQMAAPPETPEPDDEVTQMARVEDKGGKADKPAAKADEKPKKMAAGEPDGDEAPGGPPAPDAASGDTSNDPQVEKVFSDKRMQAVLDLPKKFDQLLSMFEEVLGGGMGGEGGPDAGGPGAGPGGDEPPAGGEDDLVPDDDADADAPPAGPPAKGKADKAAPGGEVDESREGMGEKPVRFGEAAYCGPTGGSVPDMGKKQKGDKPEPKKEVTKMSRIDADTAARIERLEREANLLRAEKILASLENGTDPDLKGDRLKFSRREKNLQTLVEVQMAARDEAERDTFVKEVTEEWKLNYQRVPATPADRPAGVAAHAVAANTPTSPLPIDQDEVAGVVNLIQLSRATGSPLSMEDATAKYRASRQRA